MGSTQCGNYTFYLFICIYLFHFEEVDHKTWQITITNEYFVIKIEEYINISKTATNAWRLPKRNTNFYLEVLLNSFWKKTHTHTHKKKTLKIVCGSQKKLKVNKWYQLNTSLNYTTKLKWLNYQGHVKKESYVRSIDKNTNQSSNMVKCPKNEAVHVSMIL